MVTADYLEVKIAEWGEVFIVLDSGKEYTIHGNGSYERDGSTFRIKGVRDGEWLIVEFSVDDVEHIYTHREV